jgi:histidinol-phosphate aminotransferase
MIKTEREKLMHDLGKIPIIEKVFPSDANFLLVRTKDPEFIYTALVKEGIIVRNRSKAVQGAIRITVGTRTENKRLIMALKKIQL